MALTVPKAGIMAGSAPQMASVPMPRNDTGAVFAEFGQRMAQVGGAMEQDRLQRDLGRARVSMMQGMNNLRLEFEQIGDPDTLDREFGPRTEALKQDLFQSIDPKNHDSASLIFDEMRAAHGAQLGARAIDLRQSQRRADLDALADTVVRSWAGSTPEMKAVSMGQLDDQLGQLRASGAISPEDEQAYRLKVLGSADEVEATQALNTDPHGFMDALDRGQFSALDPKTRETLRERAATRIEVDRKAALSSAGSFLTEGKNVLALGRDWNGSAQADQLLADPDVAALPAAREYIAQRDLNAAMPEFSRLPLQQKVEIAQTEAAKGIGRDYENDRLKAMQASIDLEKKGFAEDPVATAAKLNLPEAPALPDVATASADDLAAAIRARGNWAESLRSIGHTGISTIFSKEERTTLTAAIGPDKSPTDRARIAGALFSGLPGNTARAAAGEIGGDAVFATVGTMLSNGGNDVTARQIFEGQRMGRDNLAKAPTRKALGTAFMQTFGDLFQDGTGPMGDEGVARQGLMEATNALYLYKTGQNADSADFDAVAYRQSFFETLGGHGTYGNANSVGGIYPVSASGSLFGGGTYDLQIPAGRKGSDVDTAFDWMHNQVVVDPTPPGVGDTAEAVAARQNTRANWITAISANGSAPGWKNAPLDAATFSQTRLMYMGRDRYALTVTNAATGRTEVINARDGSGPWLIDIGKLLMLSGGAP